jgi:hypothetical protein
LPLNALLVVVPAWSFPRSDVYSHVMRADELSSERLEALIGR